MQLIVVKLGSADAGIHSELIRFLYGVFEYATHKECFEEFVDTTIVEQNEALRKELNEMSEVCAVIEAYAKNEIVYAVIESYIDCDLDKDTIIEKIRTRFNLTKEEAEAYYDDMPVTI